MPRIGGLGSSPPERIHERRNSGSGPNAQLREHVLSVSPGGVNTQAERIRDVLVRKAS